jgi:hypothetical protein
LRCRGRFRCHRPACGCREVAMVFREVPVFEIREIVRLWLRGEGFRSIERLARTNRKTVHRYIDAAVAAGVWTAPAARSS